MENRTDNLYTKTYWQQILFIACCLFLLLTVSETKASDGRWHSDLKSAIAEARQLNKPLIIHFYADWCGPCKKMDRDVLHSSGLLRQFGSRFVGVKLNSDHNKKIATRLEIASLPSDVFVHPDGWVIQKTSGSKSLRGYFSQLASIETKFNRIEQMKLAKNHAEQSPGPQLIPFENTGENPFQHPERNEPLKKERSQTKKDTLQLQPLKPEIKRTPLQENKTPKSATKRVGRIVGLSAFSPVTLKDQKKWVRGSRQFSETYQGITYYMRSDLETRRFKAAPELYVPYYLGCDAVILKHQLKGIPGSTRFAAFYKERLFLFAKPVTRKEFKKKPSRYSNINHKLTIDKISQQ